MVDQQALGDGGQQRARFARRLQVGAAEQADEGVLADVLGALRTVQAFAKPAEQPGAVVTIEQTYQVVVGGVLGRHAGLAAKAG
ncbi:hypothetical protein D9M68_716970 [compost metagenome]